MWLKRLGLELSTVTSREKEARFYFSCFACKAFALLFLSVQSKAGGRGTVQRPLVGGVRFRAEWFRLGRQARGSSVLPQGGVWVCRWLGSVM